MAPRLALLLPALVLAACEEGRYAVDEPLPLANNPPDLITIEWDPSRNTESDVKYIAERHCLAWDEHA